MIFNVNKEYELHKVVAAFKSDDYLKKNCINILSFDSFNESFSKENKLLFFIFKMDKFFAFIKKFKDSIYEEGTCLCLIFNVNFSKIPHYNYILFN